MSTLSLFKFNTPDGAGQMVARLGDLQKHNCSRCSTVQSCAGMLARRSRRHSNSTARQRPVHWVALWGMLFGLLFFIPILGLAVGALAGALAGKFSDYGIDDDFIKQARLKR